MPKVTRSTRSTKSVPAAATVSPVRAIVWTNGLLLSREPHRLGDAFFALVRAQLARQPVA